MLDRNQKSICHTMQTSEVLEKILVGNLSCFAKNGVVGYDPQLYWRLPMAKRLNANPTKLNKLFQVAEVGILNFIPKLTKSYLELTKTNRKEIVPYGLGVFMQGMVSCYKLYKYDSYIEIGRSISNKLDEFLIISGNTAGIPNSELANQSKLGYGITDNRTIYLVGGAECIFGYLNMYEVTGEEKYLEKATQIGDGFLDKFFRKNLGYGRMSLDYSSANDRTHILNANALAGGALAMIAKNGNKKKDDYDFVIKGILEFLNSYSNKDFIPYAGQEDASINSHWDIYDCYHTEFTLRGVDLMTKYLDVKNMFLDHARKSLDHFINHKSEIIIYKNLMKMPYRDIHAVAGYINIFNKVYASLSMEEACFYQNIIIKNIIDFSTNDGDYYYRITPISKIPLYMPRWSMAPMINGLANLIIKISQNSIQLVK